MHESFYGDQRIQLVHRTSVALIFRAAFAVCLVLCTGLVLAQQEVGAAEAAQARQLLAAPLPANADKATLIKLHFDRSEAAERLGDIQVQLAELRLAYELSGKQDTRIADRLATVTHLFGDWEGATRLREEINGGRPSEGLRFINTLGLAGYYAEIGEIKRAEALLSSNRSYLSRIGDHVAVNREHAALHWARGKVLSAQGRFAEAEAAHRISATRWAAFIKWGGIPISASDRNRLNLAESRLSSAMLDQGKLAEAEWILRGVIERSTNETGSDSINTTKLWIELGALQARQGKYNAALKVAESSVNTLERRGSRASSYITLGALQLLGNAHALGGRFEQAIPAFERRDANLRADPKAQEARTGGGSVVWGYALIRQGRAAQALPMLKAHCDLARARSDVGYATHECDAMYAYALHRAGKTEEAARLFQANVPPLLEERRNARAADRMDALLEAIAIWIVEGYMESLSVRASAGDPGAMAEMFRVADVARGSSVQRALALAASRASISDPRLAELARKEQDLGNRVAALGRIVEDLLERAEDKQPKQVIADMRRDMRTLATERESLRKDIAARFPDYAQLTEPTPVTLVQTQQLLRPGEVLFATYSAHDRSYVWAVPQIGNARFAQVGMNTEEIADAVRKLRAGLEVGDETAPVPAFDAALAYSLYDKLLAPVRDAWKDAQSLVVVPHGRLGDLPLSVLPTTPPSVVAHSANFESYREVDWLIKRIALVQLPSVAALSSLRSMKRAAPARNAFVGFGDPLFAQGQTVASASSGGLSTRNLKVAHGDAAKPRSFADYRKLPPLPDTGQEIKDIAEVMKSGEQSVLLGARASETNVKKHGLDQHRVVMFATHGLVAGDLDGLTQPALALSNPELTKETEEDGLLTMEEILGLRLNADWVVLSACNTASGDGARGEAVSGLGRAFFYAGARSLLVTSWPVETVSARLLTTDLFRRQADDASLSRAEALRRTMIELMQRGSAKDGAGKILYSYAHPLFWAPFSLVGDGAS